MPDKPACCADPSWASVRDLGEAGGFDYLLGRCGRCGAYSMNVFCTATSLAGYEPVSPADAERMQAIEAWQELKAFMREWGENNL